MSDTAEVIRGLLAAYQRWDVDGMRALLGEVATYWLPGRSPMAGEIRGRNAVIDLLARQREYLGGKTYRVTPAVMLADRDHVLLMATAEAATSTTALTWRAINAYVIRQGFVVECRVFVDELYAFDAFWEGVRPGPADRGRVAGGS